MFQLSSGYDEHFAMERSTIFKFGKPSISIRAINRLNRPWRTVSHNQRVIVLLLEIWPIYRWFSQLETSIYNGPSIAIDYPRKTHSKSPLSVLAHRRAPCRLRHHRSDPGALCRLRRLAMSKSLSLLRWQAFVLRFEFMMDIYGYVRIFMDIYGYLWIFMDIYGYLWIFMDIYGYLWISMDIYGYLWISMDIYGYLWISMDIYGYLWICMDIYGYLWISMDIYGYLWISMDMYGYLWISMDIYGYLWISMDIYGYLWISMDIYGYLWISMDI